MMSSKDDIDLIVKEYLLARGYDKAAAELEQESHIVTSSDNQQSSSALNNRPLALRILSTMTAIADETSHIGLKQLDSNTYITNYNNFRSWSLSSIDIIKPQLVSLCFPIFVHCYIGLLDLHGNEDAARGFMQQSGEAFLEYFADEVTSLSMLTDASQLRSVAFLQANPFIAQLLKNKFVVRLSRFALRVLTAFLVEADLAAVAAIVNTRVRFVKLQDEGGGDGSQGEGFGTSNGSGGAEDSTHGILMELDNYTAVQQAVTVPGSGDAHSAALGSQGRTLTLGVPGKGTVASAGAARSSGTPMGGGNRSRHLAAPDTREDSVFREWLSRLVRPQSVLSSGNSSHRNVGTVGGSKRSRDGAETVATTSNESSQYTDLSRKLQARRSANTGEGRGRQQARPLVAGSALDPSVVFATVTNTSEGMTCMHINSSATQAASGHRDNAVRVWRLTAAGSDSNGTSHFGSSLPKGRADWELDEVLPAPKNKFSTVGHAMNGHSAESGGSSEDSNLLELRGHTMPVYGVSQGASERLVLSSSADETIRLWDVGVAQCVGKYHCASPAWGVSFSPLLGDYYFASANQDKTATVYSTDRVAPLRMMTGHISDVNCVAWHPNAVYLCTGSDDKTARLWDIRTGGSVRLLTGSSTPLACAAISACGTLLAGGSDGGLIYIWDLAMGKQLAVLQGHKGPVHSVNFSKNSSPALVSGGADCSLRVWELPRSCNSETSIGLEGTETPAAAERSVVQARHTFHTKFSPVFFADYTPLNMVCSGGPFSLSHATRSRESPSFAAAAEEVGVGQVHLAGPPLASSEHETAAALGIARAIQSGRQ